MHKCASFPTSHDATPSSFGLLLSSLFLVAPCSAIVCPPPQWPLSLLLPLLALSCPFGCPSFLHLSPWLLILHCLTLCCPQTDYSSIEWRAFWTFPPLWTPTLLASPVSSAVDSGSKWPQQFLQQPIPSQFERSWMLSPRGFFPFYLRPHSSLTPSQQGLFPPLEPLNPSFPISENP